LLRLPVYFSNTKPMSTLVFYVLLIDDVKIMKLQ